MKKKNILIFIIILIPLFIFATYKFIEYIDYKSSLSNLEEYNMIPENERLTYKQVTHKNNKYLLVGFKGNNPTYADNVILLEKNSKYYVLEKIINCAISNETAYFKDGSFYIHCIGRKANIIQYELDGTEVKKSYIELNYKDVPNISQLHLFVNNIDDKYIYLFSNVKHDDSIAEGQKAKCSLETKKCIYY